MDTIGFIGLGTMGKPMAINLLKKGYEVHVFNRTVDKMEELIQMGAKTAASPAELTQSVDVLFTMLSDDAALMDVYYGENGVINGHHVGLTVIDCSTVSPETSVKIHIDLSSHMVNFLDAPVTGSKPAAINATLVFMVGGEKEVFDAQYPLLLQLGTKALYMGPTGSGSTTKLAHNTIVGINMAGFAEGLAIATKTGINLEQFIDIVLHGGASSKIAELKGSKIVSGDFSNQFSLALMHKDLGLASQLTDRYQLPTPLLQSAKNIFQTGLLKGLGDMDMSAVIQSYDQGFISSNETQERRRDTRVNMGIQIILSVYQWEQEGAFTGQNIEGTLMDLSEHGLQIMSHFPLAQDMFVVIHLPHHSKIPPITGKIIRIEVKEDYFNYGCMLTGIPPHVQQQLERYIKENIQ